MARTYNKGEWSEIYVFLQSLADGYFNIKDASLINSLGHFKINCLLRNSYSDLSEKSFYPSKIDSSEFNRISKLLFNIITNSNETTFAIDDIELFAQKHDFSLTKASSFSKSDLSGKVYDNSGNITPLLSYSIKSNIKASATLLNASSHTNFRYQVKGLNEDQVKQVNKIQTRTKLQDRLSLIHSLGGRIAFKKVDSDAFKNNLLMIDSNLDKVLANALLLFYVHKEGRIVNLIKLLAKSNPLNIDSSSYPIYENIVQRFLSRIVFNFMPSKEPLSLGNKQPFAGILVVNRQGDISLLDNLYNQEQLNTYLFNNLKLESPSSSRYHMLELTKTPHDTYEFTLNLQIRFI